MKMNTHIRNLLIKLGLTESEAQIYLVAHANPGLTFADLRQKSALSTASVYRIFEALKEKGLLTVSPENWRKTIAPLPLRFLGEKLAKEQRRLRKVELELKRIDSLHNMSAHSFTDEPVKIFSTRNQILDKYFSILNEHWDHLLAYGSSERLIDIVGRDAEHRFVDIRRRKGKSADVIITELGPYGNEMSRTCSESLRNMKLKEDSSSRDFMMYIYGNEMTVLHRDKENGDRAVVIKDPLLVKMHENNFRTMWNLS